MSRQFIQQYGTQKGEIIRDVSGNIVYACLYQAPTSGVAGFAKGATYTDTLNGIEYLNAGTTSSATWIGNAPVDLTALAATAVEINRNNQASAREVLAGATLTVTQALHDGKTIAMPAACAVTLPASTGSGSRFKFYQKIAATAVTITATAADMYGVAWVLSDNSAAVLGYNAAGSTVITFDGSTKGGIKGATVEIEDVATSLLLVRVMSAATGTEATPFS